MTTKVSDDVLRVLESVECDGPSLKITDQLDRPLYTKTAKVLTALGGKWNRKQQATLFDEDAAPLIADVLTTGFYVDAKKLFQFFETPKEIAEQLCDLACVGSGCTVFEPEAGKGAIANVAKKLGANVVVNEFQFDLAAQLQEQGFPTYANDFLKMKPEHVTEAPDGFDAIVMNPPFSRGQDFAHVMHAYDFLAPGRTLAAVTSVGWTFRSDRKAVAFREWFDRHGVGSIDLPEGAFKASGTMVRTKIAVVIKEG